MPIGFHGLGGQKLRRFHFEVHEEVIVDAETESQAIEILESFTINDLTDVYDDNLPERMNRYLIEVYGNVLVESYTEEYAEEEFLNMTVKEAMRKGLDIV